MLARRAFIWQLLAALVGIVMSAGTVLVVVRGVLLAPLAALNDRMRALASGDGSKAAEPLHGYCAELRELAESYEHLRSEKNKS